MSKVYRLKTASSVSPEKYLPDDVEYEKEKYEEYGLEKEKVLVERKNIDQIYEELTANSAIIVESSKRPEKSPAELVVRVYDGYLE